MKDFATSLLVILIFGLMVGAILYFLDLGITPSVPTDAIKI